MMVFLHVYCIFDIYFIILNVGMVETAVQAAAGKIPKTGFSRVVRLHGFSWRKVYYVFALQIFKYYWLT